MTFPDEVRELFDGRQDVAITSSGGTTLRHWCLSRAWPVKFVAGEWDNEADENVIESVTSEYGLS